MNTSYSQSTLRHNPILILLCVLSFFSVLNEMVLNVSLPDIANDLNKLPASTNWVNTAFMLSFSVGTAIYRKLLDQLGIKKLLLFGIIANCFGSVIGFVGHSFFPILILEGTKAYLDTTGIILMSLGIVFFMVFTMSFTISFLVISILFFLIFVKHIKKAENPFVDPALGKNIPFMLGVLCGGLIFGIVAGFVSMVPYMMKDVHHLSTAAIGSGIIFPGTMSVILFGYIGGLLVDRKGPLVVLTMGAALLSIGFLIAALFAEAAPWVMTMILVLVFGRLSFTKTVVSTIVSSSLKQNNAGAGMSLLNFTSFLSEGTGIAIVVGLLSVPLLDRRLLPTITEAPAYLYSNMLLLFLGIVIISWLVTLRIYKRTQRNI